MREAWKPGDNLVPQSNWYFQADKMQYCPTHYAPSLLSPERPRNSAGERENNRAHKNSKFEQSWLEPFADQKQLSKFRGSNGKPQNWLQHARFSYYKPIWR